MDELTEKVLKYKSTGEGLDTLTAQIRILVYFYPRKKGGWTWEDSSDFFLFFLDKIPGLLEKFQYRGKNFSCYLASCLRFQMLCFQRQSLQARQHEECLCRDQEADAEEAIYHYSQMDRLQDQAGERELTPDHPMGNLSLDRNRRKILLLCLKSSYYLDAATIDALSKLLQLPSGSLQSLILELREDLERCCPKLERLRVRGMKLYLMLNSYQKRHSEELDPVRKGRWSRLTSHYTLQLRRNREALKTLRIEPRHEAIAKVTGLPKGTVDSAIYTVKKRLEDLLKTS